MLPETYFHLADLVQPSKWSAFARFFGPKQTKLPHLKFIWQTTEYKDQELNTTKPVGKVDMSRSEKNTTGSVYHISGIKHRVTKRCSSDRVANSKVTHKNIPHPDSKAGAEVTNNAEDPTAGLADYVLRINTRVEHTLSSVSSAYLWYHRLSRKWIQRPLSKSKVDSVPVWECLPELVAKMPKQETLNKSPSLNTEGVADTGCTVLFGGTDTLR